MFSGPRINHGIPLKATMAIEIKQNVWIVAVIDGKLLKMIKLRITGASTYVWIESKWSNSYASSCSNPNTFTEQCFVGKSVGIDFYKISVAAESKDCIPVTLVVKATFYEQALIEDYKLTEITRSSSDFQKSYKELDVSAAMSGGYGGFSDSASASFREVSDVASKTDRSFSSKIEKREKFNKNFLQIKRRITTTINVNGAVASKESITYVDSVSIKNPESHSQLYKRGALYIRNNFGHEKGKIIGSAKNIYKETACVKKV
jgi:hypothetical protein